MTITTPDTAVMPFRKWQPKNTVPVFWKPFRRLGITVKIWLLLISRILSCCKSAQMIFWVTTMMVLLTVWKTWSMSSYRIWMLTAPFSFPPFQTLTHTPVQTGLVLMASTLGAARRKKKTGWWKLLLAALIPTILLFITLFSRCRAKVKMFSLLTSIVL